MNARDASSVANHAAAGRIAARSASIVTNATPVTSSSARICPISCSSVSCSQPSVTVPVCASVMHCHPPEPTITERRAVSRWGDVRGWPSVSGMSQAPHPPDTAVLLRAEHAVAGVLARSPRRDDARGGAAARHRRVARLGDGRAVGAGRRARRPARLPRAVVRRLVRRRRLGARVPRDRAGAGRGAARPRVRRRAPRLARAAARGPAARGRGDPRRAPLRVLHPAASARTSRSARSSSSRASRSRRAPELLETMESLGAADRPVPRALPRRGGAARQRGAHARDARRRLRRDRRDGRQRHDRRRQPRGRADLRLGRGRARGPRAGRAAGPAGAARRPPPRGRALPAHGRGRRRRAPCRAAGAAGGRQRVPRRDRDPAARDGRPARLHGLHPRPHGAPPRASRRSARWARSRPPCGAWPRWWRGRRTRRACSTRSPRRSAACSAPTRPT